MHKFKNVVAGIVLGFVSMVTIVSTTGFSGCKGPIEWTPELAYQTAYCAGITAGAVMSAKKLPPDVTDAVLGVMDRCRAAIPNPGQTFTVVWAPILEQYLADHSEIQESNKTLIKLMFSLIVTAIDAKCADIPELLKAEEYARSVVDGLFKGVQYSLKPSNVNDCGDGCRDCTLLARARRIDCDLYKKLDAMTRAAKYLQSATEPLRSS